MIPSNSILHVLVPDFDSFNQKVYDALKNNKINRKSTEFDMLEVLVKEGIDEDEYNKKDFYAYKVRVHIDTLLESVQGKLKIVYLSIGEFKRKQMEHWSK
jgi:hypothetical protein